MSQKMFSLILATINRENHVDRFLASINESNYELSKVEVIVIDQNKHIILDSIIKKYSSKIEIKHIKSNLKGISKNRNLGILESKGKIIAFPDDDCEYLKDTLKTVEKQFQNEPNLEIIFGRIIDENGKDCIRKWSKKKEVITRKNFIKFSSMITIFTQNKKKFFDERFGPGEKYISTEDVDYIYSSLLNKTYLYNPEIIVYHPNGFNNFSKEKAFNYGLGFGAFCRKYSDFYTLKIFILGLGWSLFRSLFYITVLRFRESGIWFNSFMGRLCGFKKYKN